MQNSEGQQIVFPLQNRQKHVRGVAWGNFSSDYGLTQILCAFFERFKKVGLNVPVITLSYGDSSISTTQDESSYADLVAWVSQRPFLPVFNSLLSQLHSGVFLLSGYYFNEFSEFLTSVDFAEFGLTLSPAWPDDIAGLKLTLSQLNYTREEYAITDSVRFANIFLPEQYTFAAYPIPVTGHETVLETSETVFGEISIAKYPTGQRVEAQLTENRKLCWTGFMKPCQVSDYTLILQAQ